MCTRGEAEGVEVEYRSSPPCDFYRSPTADDTPIHEIGNSGVDWFSHPIPLDYSRRIARLAPRKKWRLVTSICSLFGHWLNSGMPKTTESTPDHSSTGRDAYNIVSDTVVGMNVRKSDNLFQIKVILVCVLIGIPVGASVGALMSDADNRLVGALVGGLGLGFAGVVFGLFGSGIYLMIYRAVRHAKGKHD